ncbi:MAG: pilus assembly protein TadG-related protein [Dehalococcoidia bacterium]
MLTHLRTDERGQMAWAFVLLLLVVFMFFAVAFDAGMWFFDHRTAQNQAEAAALAAVQELPAADTSAATTAAQTWLTRNDTNSATDGCAPNWIEFDDVNSDGKYDEVRVCLRRSSSVIFAALSNITDVQVSASATALTGPVSIANVMPWAVIPPDPDCSEGEICTSNDIDGDGLYDTDGECRADFDECPWGLNKNNLYVFKSGGGGNTGIIDACGNGAVNYRDCIEGEAISGFFEEGQNVVVGLQGGNLGQNTDNALRDRYADEGAPWPCDVAATPDEITGYDADGRTEAYSRFATGDCADRLVLIPILYSMPPQGGGSDSLQVLGVATFGLASWNRVSNKDAYGTDGSACSTNNDAGYGCGMVWGYLMEGLRPPDFLLQRISDTDNPFAPLLIALVE